MRIVLLGPPGAGKGTQAHLLKADLQIIHISTGDIFREEMKNHTPLGQDIKKYVDKGKLVPDSVVTKIVANTLSLMDPQGPGYLLDGFPRTEKQAKDLDKILARLKQPLDYAIYMEATLPVIVQRLTGRRVCKKCGSLYHALNRPPKKEGTCDQCGGALYQRADDNEETIKIRMKEYLANTMPMVKYYESRGMLLKVDSDKDSADVQAILMKKLKEDGKLDPHKDKRRN